MELVNESYFIKKSLSDIKYCSILEFMMVLKCFHINALCCEKQYSVVCFVGFFLFQFVWLFKAFRRFKVADELFVQCVGLLQV